MTTKIVARGRRSLRRTVQNPEQLRIKAALLRAQFPRPVPELVRLEWNRYAQAIEAARVLETEATEWELAIAARRGRR